MRRTRTLAALAAGLLAGCDSTPTDRPEPARPAAASTAQPSRGNPDVRTGTPKPDPKRLAFDPTTNTLTVYDMPGAAQWMVRTDGDRSGVPIARTHRFATPVRAATVSVFYAVPNGGTSAPVTLQDILEAHTPPVIH
jgi:hypothetical protein